MKDFRRVRGEIVRVPRIIPYLEVRSNESIKKGIIETDSLKSSQSGGRLSDGEYVSGDHVDIFLASQVRSIEARMLVMSHQSTATGKIEEICCWLEKDYENYFYDCFRLLPGRRSWALCGETITRHFTQNARHYELTLQFSRGWDRR